MTRFKKPTGTIYLRNVPVTIRDPFHAACACRGKTMKEVLTEFMRTYSQQTLKLDKRKK